MHLNKGWLALCVVAVLAGCASKPLPPPEPDMTKLVIVNKTVPTELAGQAGVALPSMGGKP